MKKGRKKRVTSTKKFNHEKCYSHPSTWAFFAALIYAFVSLFVWIFVPSINSLYGFTLTAMGVFALFGIYGAMKEVKKKRKDWIYIGVGVMGLSQLFFIITSQTSEAVSLIVSFLLSLASLVMFIVGLVQAAKNKDEVYKIVMGTFFIIFGLWFTFIFGFASVVVLLI